jgi:hypothetical protein
MANKFPTISDLNPFTRGSNSYYHDAEELTDKKSSLLAIYNEDNYVNRTNVFHGVTTYEGIVIDEPKLLTSLTRDQQSSFTDLDVTDNNKYAMKVHIPELHSIIGNPCDVGDLKQLSQDQKKAETINRIKNHPWFVGDTSDNILTSTRVTFGSIVSVSFEKSPEGGATINGIFNSLVEPSSIQSIEDLCDKKLSEIYNNAAIQTLDGLITSGTPVSTGTSPTSTFVGNKDDPSFVQCKPSYYPNLQKKETTFSKYEQSSVVEVIKKVQPDKNWQKIMWCYIRQEQGFTYPNNNVAGINIDSGNFGPESQFDYQTCYRDAQRFRVFAGFSSLERGMKVFSDIVYNRRSKYKLPGDGTIQEQAEKIAYNYFSWWTILATPEQIELLKKQGYFILSNGTKVEKDYNKTYSNFVSFLNEYQKLF